MGSYYLKPLVIHLNSVLSLSPSPQPELFPPNSQPLLVLVNSKSGGGQGADMLAAFQRLLNPHQVYSLMEGGPLIGYVPLTNLAILITSLRVASATLPHAAFVAYCTAGILQELHTTFILRHCLILLWM